MRLAGAAIMFTVLALFLGDAVLVFLSEQLDRRRRAWRLELAREQTRQIELQQRRDAIIWQKLQGDHQATGLGPAMASLDTSDGDSAGIILGPRSRSAPAGPGSPPPSQ
jgi:hypothetical protein